MPRRYRDQTFRKTDLVRALKAARTAGVPSPRVEIDRHGKIVIMPGDSPNDRAAENPWDEVLTNAADQKRSS
jgi:hypothetical protein